MRGLNNYFWKGSSTEGHLCFKIDWASLIVGSKLTVLALFFFFILYLQHEKLVVKIHCSFMHLVQECWNKDLNLIRIYKLSYEDD